MNIYRLTLPILAFALFATAALAATSNGTGMSHQSMEEHQTVAASMPQANNAPPRVTVTVAPAAAAATSSLLTPQNYWWKDR